MKQNQKNDMKSLMYFISLLIISGACNLSPTAEEIENDHQSSSIFEGEWTWLETKGEGIAGPYVSDSLSTGYSWKLTFFHSNGKGGSLSYIRSYKNGQREECIGSYSYTDDKDLRELKYACNSWLNNNRWENYRWEMKVINQKSHLYLKNIEGCCDDSFEHHFLLTRVPN